MSVSPKSLHLFCVLPSDISAIKQNIVPVDCTTIIDITHSDRVPIPAQSWVRTRVRRGVPGKGPVILSGGAHKIPIRGRETWLEVTNSQRCPKKFAGLILETPFTSMVDAAKNVYPYIPVGFLLKDKYENDKKIKNINIPVLVMHGEADQIIPFKMGKKIFDIANQPKYSYFTKDDDHMMNFNEKLIDTLRVFIDKN